MAKHDTANQHAQLQSRNSQAGQRLAVANQIPRGSHWATNVSGVILWIAAWTNIGQIVVQTSVVDTRDEEDHVVQLELRW